MTASKLNKQARVKKSDAAVGAQEIGDETVAIRKSSWPKRKSTNASGKREAPKGKRPKKKLMLVAIILYTRQTHLMWRLCTSP